MWDVGEINLSGREWSGVVVYTGMNVKGACIGSEECAFVVWMDGWIVS